jgi:hypothetical protein
VEDTLVDYVRSRAASASPAKDTEDVVVEGVSPREAEGEQVEVVGAAPADEDAASDSECAPDGTQEAQAAQEELEGRPRRQRRLPAALNGPEWVGMGGGQLQ